MQTKLRAAHAEAILSGATSDIQEWMKESPEAAAIVSGVEPVKKGETKKPTPTSTPTGTLISAENPKSIAGPTPDLQPIYDILARAGWKLSEDKTKYVSTDGQESFRVSDLKEGKPEMTATMLAATDRGNIVDEVLRDFATPFTKDKLSLKDIIVNNYIQGKNAVESKQQIAVMVSNTLTIGKVAEKNRYTIDEGFIKDMSNVLYDLALRFQDYTWHTSLPTMIGNLVGKMYGGTIDLLLEKDGKYFIIDLKTSVKSRRLNEKLYDKNDQIQQNAYAELFEQLTGKPISGIYILNLLTKTTADRTLQAVELDMHKNQKGQDTVLTPLPRTSVAELKGYKPETTDVDEDIKSFFSNIGNQGLAVMEADILKTGKSVIPNISKATPEQRQKIDSDIEELKKKYPEKNITSKIENDKLIAESGEVVPATDPKAELQKRISAVEEQIKTTYRFMGDTDSNAAIVQAQKDIKSGEEELKALKEQLATLEGKGTPAAPATDAKEENKFNKKNLFTVTPQQGVSDNKAKAKASIATQYIGFGEGIVGSDGKRSTTEIYREQAGQYANTGNYSANDVIFVSVPGKRGNANIAKREQDKTIKEAIKAVDAGATILTDNKSYIDASAYNTGEKRLYANMEAKGYNYSQITIDGQVIGTWSKTQPAPSAPVTPTPTTGVKPTIDLSREWSGDLESRPVYTPEGVNTMRTKSAKPNEHFGNPWSEGGYSGTIKTSSVAEAAQNYKEWLLGTKFQDVKPEQRAWILDQINQGKLDGANLLYSKKLMDRGKGSHANSLAEVVEQLRSKPTSVSTTPTTTAKTAVPSRFAGKVIWAQPGTVNPEIFEKFDVVNSDDIVEKIAARRDITAEEGKTIHQTIQNQPSAVRADIQNEVKAEIERLKGQGKTIITSNWYMQGSSLVDITSSPAEKEAVFMGKNMSPEESVKAFNKWLSDNRMRKEDYLATQEADWVSQQMSGKTLIEKNTQATVQQLFEREQVRSTPLRSITNAGNSQYLIDSITAYMYNPEIRGAYTIKDANGAERVLTPEEVAELAKKRAKRVMNKEEFNNFSQEIDKMMAQQVTPTQTTVSQEDKSSAQDAINSASEMPTAKTNEIVNNAENKSQKDVDDDFDNNLNCE